MEALAETERDNTHRIGQWRIISMENQCVRRGVVSLENEN